VIEIFLDENLSEYVADALNSLNKGYFRDVNVYSTKIKFGKGVPDEEIIPLSEKLEEF
jgi:PIN like domain